jgi:protein SDA1
MLNLPQLQNLIKRDPCSHQDEFMQQYRHYQSRLAVFKLRLHEEDKELGHLLSFMSHVANCYPEICAEFPQQLMTLLQQHAPILHPMTRRNLVQALMLLRNKSFIKMER